MSEVRVPDNLPKWIADHMQRYLETDGADGHMWDSAPVGGPGPIPTLLLTTTGRRSGKSLVMPLIYGEANGAYVVIASKGGAPKHPAWYLNLAANTEVEVQVIADRFRAQARTATGDERTNLWKKMREIYPPYDEYQGKTDREIPVVVLERING
jgi:deazaflavin-dependent oxidoreductase (nitroreductase family)